MKNITMRYAVTLAIVALCAQGCAKKDDSLRNRKEAADRAAEAAKGTPSGNKSAAEIAAAAQKESEAKAAALAASAAAEAGKNADAATGTSRTTTTTIMTGTDSNTATAGGATGTSPATTVTDATTTGTAGASPAAGNTTVAGNPNAEGNNAGASASSANSAEANAGTQQASAGSAADGKAAASAAVAKKMEAPASAFDPALTYKEKCVNPIKMKAVEGETELSDISQILSNDKGSYKLAETIYFSIIQAKGSTAKSYLYAVGQPMETPEKLSAPVSEPLKIVVVCHTFKDDGKVTVGDQAKLPVLTGSTENINEFAADSGKSHSRRTDTIVISKEGIKTVSKITPSEFQITKGQDAKLKYKVLNLKLENGGLIRRTAYRVTDAAGTHYTIITSAMYTKSE
ncbi:MAG: hypothetical protein EOP06_13105 [Proteobacteria bacterium]|nr:MAG: hypothetical protein EOP06_13105 [Pseudomonadota bacterium]